MSAEVVPFRGFTGNPPKGAPSIPAPHNLETPPQQVECVPQTSRPGGACNTPGHGTPTLEVGMQTQDIPVGLCQCGCGAQTTIAKCSDAARGHIKGRPVRFIRGHANRRRGDRYQVDPDTGCWVWQMARTTDGYGSVYLDGRSVLAHRAAYFAAYGYLPDFLDHICRNRACVNPEHLRPATLAQNAQNTAGRNGLRGTRQTQYGRWTARVGLNGQGHYLGTFDTEDEAAAAAAAFRSEHMPFSSEARS